MEDTVIDLPENEVEQAPPSLKRSIDNTTANSARDDEDESNPWQRPAPAADDEPESKKRKVDVTSDNASKKRGQRMFGVLMGTLNQFKKEGKKETQSDAAKRRSAIEEKLASKLRAETEENERKSSRSRLERTLKLDVLRKEEEKYLLDSIYKKRQTAALNMAHFLCTSITQPKTVSAATPAHPSVATRPAISPNLPLHSSPGHALPPIYYLPAKLLPEQTTTLADQASAARKAVDLDREDWADEARTREDELEVLRRKRDEGLEDIAREERRERVTRDRELRDAEEEQERRGSLSAPNNDATGNVLSPLPMDQDAQDDSRY